MQHLTQDVSVSIKTNESPSSSLFVVVAVDVSRSAPTSSSSTADMDVFSESSRDSSIASDEFTSDSSWADSNEIAPPLCRRGDDDNNGGDCCGDVSSIVRDSAKRSPIVRDDCSEPTTKSNGGAGRSSFWTTLKNAFVGSGSGGNDDESSRGEIVATEAKSGRKGVVSVDSSIRACDGSLDVDDSVEFIFDTFQSLIHTPDTSTTYILGVIKKLTRSINRSKNVTLLYRTLVDSDRFCDAIVPYETQLSMCCYFGFVQYEFRRPLDKMVYNVLKEQSFDMIYPNYAVMATDAHLQVFGRYVKMLTKAKRFLRVDRDKLDAIARRINDTCETNFKHVLATLALTFAHELSSRPMREALRNLPTMVENTVTKIDATMTDIHELLEHTLRSSSSLTSNEILTATSVTTPMKKAIAEKKSTNAASKTTTHSGSGIPRRKRPADSLNDDIVARPPTKKRSSSPTKKRSSPPTTKRIIA